MDEAERAARGMPNADAMQRARRLLSGAPYARSYADGEWLQHAFARALAEYGHQRAMSAIEEAAMVAASYRDRNGLDVSAVGAAAAIHYEIKALSLPKPEGGEE